jgi:HAD superfamily hydrolase (TIGR01509 family)
VIEAAVIDLGGVAARFLPERRLAALSELSGVPEAQIQAEIFDSGFESRAERGVFSSKQVFQKLEAVLGRVPRDALLQAWSQAFEADAEVLAVVARIPGPRTLFTNNGPMLDACFAGPLQELAMPFTKLVCSWHVNAVKPEPAAFERATGLLAAAPSRLLLLDDSAANVEAARRCGWNAEQVSGAAAFTAALERHRVLR